MRGGTSPQGYTIIEVMIFLAISGFMFLLAAAFVSGKQGKAEFQQGMSDINTQVQQVINDVSNGFYPSTNIACSAGPTPGALSFNTGGLGQGTNSGCVFMGKVIQFAATTPAPSGTTPDATAYDILSVAGRQYTGDATTAPPANFAAAYPRVVYQSVDLTQYNTLEWGLQVTSMHYNDSVSDSAVPIGAVGFFGSFSQTSTDNTLQSGSQSVLAVPLATPLLSGGSGTTDYTVDNYVKDNSFSGAMDTELKNNPDPDITVCFTSGSGEYGVLNIGSSSGQRLTTSTQTYTDQSSWQTEAGCS